VDLRNLERRPKRVAKADSRCDRRDHLEKILSTLKLPVLKRTPKGGRSTTPSARELAEKHRCPRWCASFREIDKLKGTYIERSARRSTRAPGRIHSAFCRRWRDGAALLERSQLQNIPIRTELGREIRAAFVRPKGTCCEPDYSRSSYGVLSAPLRRSRADRGVLETEGRRCTRTQRLWSSMCRRARSPGDAPARQDHQFGVILRMGDAALARQLDITRAEARASSRRISSR